MKLTMKLTMREPASMTTDTWSRRVTSDFNSALKYNNKPRLTSYKTKEVKKFLLQQESTSHIHTPIGTQ